mgnify:CR=1 FL=1
MGYSVLKFWLKLLYNVPQGPCAIINLIKKQTINKRGKKGGSSKTKPSNRGLLTYPHRGSVLQKTKITILLLIPNVVCKGTLLLNNR